MVIKYGQFDEAFIINFTSHDFAIIVVWTLLFIGSYGIDTNVIHLFILFEHQCCVHCLDMNVVVYTTFMFKQYKPMK
jgi:hypothetical protein